MSERQAAEKPRLSRRAEVEDDSFSVREAAAGALGKIEARDK